MLKIYFFIYALSMIVNQIESLDSELCKLLVKERHCIIEYAARNRWSHTERYSYDWDQKKCILIRWADHCGAVPAQTNNFASDSECRNECGGWA
ncbi:PREDICTED: uncharacterized protein LOC106111834 [Papilio polytes]|uniref:uncharacterized protein LOC106111834 n=1 Tax=Papilio polytes TaxID=76194 RepID=UPI0006765B2D|nr:PREDICTED: uncharacterized protein LOC106111834 [Papilio polytes]